MKRVQWTVGAARTQSVLHFLIAPLMLWVGFFGLQEVSHYLFSRASSDRVGLALGVLLVSLMGFVAWGLWSRHAGARRAATVFLGPARESPAVWERK